MKSHEPGPPRWAEALLRSLLRPADRESISGDLLEEYRAAKHPALGPLRANVWYVKHVASLFWRLIRPCALTIAGVTLAGLTVTSVMGRGIGLAYGSVVQAPGVSLLHALLYLWAGYHGAHRTRLIRSGLLTAAGTSFVGVTVFFLAVAIRTPDLLRAPFANPFIFVILSIYVLIAVGYGLLVGAVGSILGKSMGPAASVEVRAS